MTLPHADQIPDDDDGLGAARGVVWAFVFEVGIAALIIFGGWCLLAGGRP